MDEERRLNAALERADDLVVSSLRRQERERQKRRGLLMVAAIVGSLACGIGIGALGMRWWMGTPSQIAATAAAEPTRLFVASTETPTTGPCEVKSGNTWRPATIVDRDPNFFLVRYDGWSDFFNEWVTPDRLRAPGSKIDRIGFARPNPPRKKPPIAMTQNNP